MMMELDQVVALAVLAATMPAAVPTLVQGSLGQQFQGFGNALASGAELQSLISIQNLTMQQFLAGARQIIPGYTISQFMPGGNETLPYGSRILVISGNAYTVDVGTNESAGID